MNGGTGGVKAAQTIALVRAAFDIASRSTAGVMNKYVGAATSEKDGALKHVFGTN